MKYQKVDEGLFVGFHYDMINSRKKNNPLPLRKTTVSILIPVLERAEEKTTLSESVTQYLRDKDDKHLAKKICIKKLFTTSKHTAGGQYLTKQVRTKVWNWFLKNN